MINSSRLTPRWQIAINGAELSENAKLAVKEITFEEKLGSTSKVEVTFEDGELFDLTVAAVAPESEFSLQIGWEHELVEVFNGELTEDAPEFAHMRPNELRLTAYDRSWRLKRFEWPPEVYAKNKLLEVVTAVLDKYRPDGFDYVIDTNAPLKDYILNDYQVGFRPDDQTDWYFLSLIAEENDLALFVRNKTIYLVAYDSFLQPTATQVGIVPTFKLNFYYRPLAEQEVDPLGVELYHFRPRRRPLKQRQKVELIAWTSVDAQGKKRGSADLQPQRGQLDYTMLKVATTRVETLVVSGSVRSTNEAIILAQAEIEKRARKFIEGQGSLKGWPHVRMGQTHNFIVRGFNDFGAKYSGDYFITGTEHNWSRDEGYRTSFDVERSALSV